MSTKRDDELPPAEAHRRFESALRGARRVGHKSMAQLQQEKKQSKQNMDKSPGKKKAR
jgi:hypothetical protein